MIANTSLAAFSATSLRPPEARRPAGPVDAPPPVERVRAQAEARIERDGLAEVGRTPAPIIPGKPMPRGSLLDLSV